jgi:hypothetical protein
MLQINRGRHKAVHSDQLERWLGAESVAHVSTSMSGWYGPPIALAHVPGAVYAGRDGDFSGVLRAGYEATLWDRVEDFSRRIRRGFRVAARNSMYQANAGFASFSDLIAEATAGKRREFWFHKTAAASADSGISSIWGLGASPPAGANASNAPGGDVPTDATTGAFPFTNPTGGDTQHFVGMTGVGTQTASLLLYDRIFQVNKTASSTATEAVTGVPTRYQSTTATNADYIGGNFMFAEIGSATLGSTAHNWEDTLYTNQAGTGSQDAPNWAGVNAGIARRLDHNVQLQWFAPLLAGDIGVMNITQMKNSASVTGAVNFVIGHPIAWLPFPQANVLCTLDGINTALNLVRIFDDAALALLEIGKAGSAAAQYTGSIVTVAG